jgi:hypothetical protein
MVAAETFSPEKLSPLTPYPPTRRPRRRRRRKRSPASVPHWARHCWCPAVCAGRLRRRVRRRPGGACCPRAAALLRVLGVGLGLLPLRLRLRAPRAPRPLSGGSSRQSSRGEILDAARCSSHRLVVRTQARPGANPGLVCAPTRTADHQDSSRTPTRVRAHLLARRDRGHGDRRFIGMGMM